MKYRKTFFKNWHKRRNNFPLAMDKETPCWWWCSYFSQGHSRWQLFVHPSFAILCLELIIIKSNQIQAAVQEEEDRDRDLWTPMPPTDLSSSAQHRWAIDTGLLPHHTAGVEGITQGPGQLLGQPAVGPTMCEYVVDRWERKRSGKAWALCKKRDGTGDEKPTVSG